LSVLELTGGAVAGASEVFIEEETCKLAIYANSPRDIQKCKLDLDTKLDKAMTTIIWKEKPGYAADREFIVQLTQNQVHETVSPSMIHNMFLNIYFECLTLIFCCTRFVD